MITAIRILLIYAVGAIAGLALYVALFALPVGGAILFYRGIVLALIAAVALAVALHAGRKWLRVDLATGIGVVLTGLAFNICFLVLFPVTIDRSISVFLLSRLAAEERMTARQLQDRFTGEYVIGMRQIPRRVEEQQASGNVIVDESGAIRLTARGARFVSLAKAASRWFRTDPRFIDPAAAEPSP